MSSICSLYVWSLHPIAILALHNLALIIVATHRLNITAYVLRKLNILGHKYGGHCVQQVGRQKPLWAWKIGKMSNFGIPFLATTELPFLLFIGSTRFEDKITSEYIINWLITRKVRSHTISVHYCNSFWVASFTGRPEWFTFGLVSDQKGRW